MIKREDLEELTFVLNEFERRHPKLRVVGILVEEDGAPEMGVATSLLPVDTAIVIANAMLTVGEEPESTVKAPLRN